MCFNIDLRTACTHTESPCLTDTDPALAETMPSVDVEHVETIDDVETIDVETIDDVDDMGLQDAMVGTVHVVAVDKIEYATGQSKKRAAEAKATEASKSTRITIESLLNAPVEMASGWPVRAEDAPDESPWGPKRLKQDMEMWTRNLEEIEETAACSPSQDHTDPPRIEVDYEPRPSKCDRLPQWMAGASSETSSETSGTASQLEAARRLEAAEALCLLFHSAPEKSMTQPRYVGGWSTETTSDVAASPSESSFVEAGDHYTY